jgi:hypothetical protein
MEGISYAHAVSRNNFDPRMMLLDPMLAEIDEESKDHKADP